MTLPRTRLLKPHNKDCAMNKHHPDQPWAYFGSARVPEQGGLDNSEPVYYCSEDGRRIAWGHFRYLTVGCNDTGCPAVMMVSENDLLSLAQAALEVKRG